MYDLILELEKLTLQIVKEIHTLTYEQLADFVEQREQLIAQMQAIPLPMQTLNASSKERLAGILQYDSILIATMDQLKQEAHSGLAKLGIARTQKGGYDIDFTPDSVFFDKRK